MKRIFPIDIVEAKIERCFRNSDWPGLIRAANHLMKHFDWTVPEDGDSPGSHGLTGGNA